MSDPVATALAQVLAAVATAILVLATAWARRLNKDDDDKKPRRRRRSGWDETVDDES